MVYHFQGEIHLGMSNLQMMFSRMKLVAADALAFLKAIVSTHLV